MKLYLVRHGETDWNIANKIQGQTDTVLNGKGENRPRPLRQSLQGKIIALQRFMPAERSGQRKQQKS